MKRRPLLGLVAFLALVPLACGGGGGGGGGGDAAGGGEAAQVKKLSTPLGAQGNLGDWSDPANGYVEILYNISHKAYSKVDVKVEFAVDWNEDGLVTADEWREAAGAAGQGDGTEGLTTSPGAGSRHVFVWDSTADVPAPDEAGGIGPGRYVSLDFQYDASGRLVTDEDGQPEYASYPGARVKVTVMDADASTRETSPFDISNNTTPFIAPEVLSAGLSEGIDIMYRPVDENGDLVSIAVDYSTDGGTTWLPATPTAGTQITGLATGVDEASAPEHTFTWDTVADVGTVRIDEVLVRVKPFDDKREHGDALEIPAPFEVENWAIFTLAGQNLSTTRVDHTATTLKNGQVLVAGGRATPGGAALASAEVFYPSLGPTTTGTLSATTGAPSVARAEHAVARLYDGRVLLAGGAGASGVLTSVEIYDPSAGTFSTTGSLTAGRKNASCALLLSGKVLVAGGLDGSGNALITSEIFDPATGTWSSGPALRTARSGAAATVLGDGRVLIPGGLSGTNTSLDTAEVYDPVVDLFLPTIDLDAARRNHSITRMRDGQVLMAGGLATSALGGMETFDPDTDVCAATSASLTTARSQHLAVELGDGTVALIGGFDVSNNVLRTGQVWDPATDTLADPKGIMKGGCAAGAAATLQNGRPAIFGGLGTQTTATGVVEIYTPQGGSNDLPQATVVTPGTPEFPSLGVRVNYSLIDAEGDAARCRFLYSTDGGKTWSPCTPSPSTILGDTNDGTEGLGASASGVAHLYIWDALTDIGRVDSLTTRVRIIPYGAEEGVVAETFNFELKANAPVITYMADLVGDQFGAISFPFELLDSDDDPATVKYEYSTDGGSTWSTATAAAGSVDPTASLDTLKDDKRVPYTFIWDSVRDIAAPRNGRSDVTFRIYPSDVDPGIPDQQVGFSIVTDPDGLFLVSWHPLGQSPLLPTQSYVGSVELNRPVVFNFNANVAGTTATKETIQVYATGAKVDGYFDVSGKVVTFYPQVPDDRGLQTLAASTSYTIQVPGYDPASPSTPLLEKDDPGASTGDYSSLYCLLTDTKPSAFSTGTLYMAESTGPGVASLDTPSPTTGVSVGTRIEFTASEPLDIDTIVYPNVQAVVVGTNVDSVIPGTIFVTNYVGPAARSVITFTPKVALPASATVKLVFGTAVKDLYGNAATADTQSFTTEAGTSKSFSLSEGFTGTSNRNASQTTAYWGTKTSGRLTGLDDGGTGADGALTVTSGTTTLAGTSYNFTTVTVNSGATLKFSASSAVTLKARAGVTVNGTISVAGANGDNSAYYYFYRSTPGSSVLSNSGGTGAAGGGSGGSTTGKLPTSSSTYQQNNGGVGGGSGGGKGATCTLYYYGSGGGGGGFAEAGQTGQTYSASYGAGGKGGSTYGNADLSKSMNAGSGGGGGSGGCYYYYRSTTYFYYYAGIGAGGGAGGGALTVVTDGKINIGSSGLITANGGTGGKGSYFAAGCGGSGSGGALWLKAGRGIVKGGTISAAGGPQSTNASASYNNRGGAGGGGRMRLEEPKPPEALLIARGDMATAVNTGITDGGTLAGTDGKLAPSGDYTLTTSASKSTWYFTEIDIKSGTTLTIAGDRAARLVSRDGIKVDGVIQANGSEGTRGAYYSNTSIPSRSGGKAAPGGSRGGRSYTKSGKPTSPEKAEKGLGSGGGNSGTTGGPYSSTYWYYPGAGAGASYGTTGTKGRKYAWVSSTYKPGTDGTAGSTYGSTSGLSHTNIPGGSGGGGGTNSMRKSGSSYYYYTGGDGGGGGGALTLETPKTLKLAGKVNLIGGKGQAGYSNQGACGGGGSGGAALLRAGKFDIPLGTADTSGGIGQGYYTYTYYGYGGTGGNGRIKLESTTAFSVTSADSLKTGSLTTAVFTAKDTGVTTWQDAGALNPTFTGLTSTVYPSDGSQTNVTLEAAQSDPETGAADEDTLVQLTAAEVAAGKADGYRWYRTRMVLDPGTSDPYVSAVGVTGSIVTK